MPQDKALGLSGRMEKAGWQLAKWKSTSAVNHWGQCSAGAMSLPIWHAHGFPLRVTSKKWNQVWGKKLNESQDENVLNLVGATNICSHGNLRPEPAV